MIPYRGILPGSPLAAQLSDHSSLARHLNVVGRLARVLALADGWDEERAAQLQEAAALHDLGKLFLDPNVLCTPGPLTDSDWKLVQMHPELGWAFLVASGNSPTTQLAAMICLEHHERWDGAGYPHGKTGEFIDPASQIVSICDAYAALREERPYKSGHSHRQAVQRLLADFNDKGSAFSPSKLRLFAECEAQIEAAYCLDLNAGLGCTQLH